MSGSLNHIVGSDGKFTVQYIENLGDAHEALEECFHLIRAMTGGRKQLVNVYCKELGYSTIARNMTADQ